MEGYHPGVIQQTHSFLQPMWRLQLFSWLWTCCSSCLSHVTVSLSLPVAQLKFRLLYSFLQNQHFFQHITLTAKAAFSFPAIEPGHTRSTPESCINKYQQWLLHSRFSVKEKTVSQAGTTQAPITMSRIHIWRSWGNLSWSAGRLPTCTPSPLSQRRKVNQLWLPAFIEQSSDPELQMNTNAAYNGKSIGLYSSESDSVTTHTHKGTVWIMANNNMKTPCKTDSAVLHSHPPFNFPHTSTWLKMNNPTH